MADTTLATRNYEGLFLFGTAFTSKVDDALSTVRGFIEKHGGSPAVLKKWDDRKLAYEVEKQTRGLYVLTYFAAPPGSIKPIEREVNLSPDVLRCMILDGSHLSAAEVEAMVPQKPEPKPERQSLGDDDDRGGRGVTRGDGGDRPGPARPSRGAGRGGKRRRVTSRSRGGSGDDCPDENFFLPPRRREAVLSDVTSRQTFRVRNFVRSHWYDVARGVTRVCGRRRESDAPDPEIDRWPASTK